MAYGQRNSVLSVGEAIPQWRAPADSGRGGRTRNTGAPPARRPPTLKGMSGVTLSQDEARGGQRPRGRQARGGGTTGKP